MKKIALISTFCDTEEKQNVLYENIVKLKEFGVDVMALSPNFITLPQHIISSCDYFFYISMIFFHPSFYLIGRSGTKLSHAYT